MRVLGYYTISNSGVAFDVVPENLPRHPVPVALIGRLAVDITAESQTGRNTFDSCAAVGTARREDRWNLAVVVNALDESARNFYMKYSFEELMDDRLHLYLSMKTIERLDL